MYLQPLNSHIANYNYLEVNYQLAIIGNRYIVACSCRCWFKANRCLKYTYKGQEMNNRINKEPINQSNFVPL